MWSFAMCLLATCWLSSTLAHPDLWMGMLESGFFPQYQCGSHPPKAFGQHLPPVPDPTIGFVVRDLMTSQPATTWCPSGLYTVDVTFPTPREMFISTSRGLLGNNSGACGGVQQAYRDPSMMFSNTVSAPEIGKSTDTLEIKVTSARNMLSEYLQSSVVLPMGTGCPGQPSLDSPPPHPPPPALKPPSAHPPALAVQPAPTSHAPPYSPRARFPPPPYYGTVRPQYPPHYRPPAPYYPCPATPAYSPPAYRATYGPAYAPHYTYCGSPYPPNYGPPYYGSSNTYPPAYQTPSYQGPSSYPPSNLPIVAPFQEFPTPPVGQQPAPSLRLSPPPRPPRSPRPPRPPQSTRRRRPPPHSEAS